MWTTQQQAQNIAVAIDIPEILWKPYLMSVATPNGSSRSQGEAKAAHPSNDISDMIVVLRAPQLGQLLLQSLANLLSRQEHLRTAVNVVELCEWAIVSHVGHDNCFLAVLQLESAAQDCVSDECGVSVRDTAFVG